MAEIRRNLPRLRGKMSARALSLEAGLSASHVNTIENGTTKNVELETLAKLAAVLKVKPSDIDPDLARPAAAGGPVDRFVSRKVEDVRRWAEAELKASRVPDDVDLETAVDVLEGAWRRKGGMIPAPALLDAGPIQPSRVLDETTDDPREAAIVLVLRDHPKSEHKGIRAKLAAAALAKGEQNSVESWLARFKVVLGGKTVTERGAKGGKAEREAKQREARAKAQFGARRS